MLSGSQNDDDRKGTLSQIAPLKTILFDIDGTLCDSDPIHFIAFLEVLPKIGFNNGEPITRQFYVDNFSGKHNSDVVKMLFPNDHEAGTKFMEDKEVLVRKLCVEHLKEVKGLTKFCEWIKARGYKRAAVTNAERESAELFIEIAGLTDFFQAVIIGNECERPKPFPDPYLKALEVLGASADNTIIFEDSFTGIQAGVEAGMPVIGLLTGNPEEVLMEARPAFLIRDYEDPKLWSALEELDRLAPGGGSTE